MNWSVGLGWVGLVNGNGGLFLVYIPGFWIGKDGWKLQGLK